MVNSKIRLIIFFATKDGEALYSQQKQDWSWLWLRSSTPYCQIRLKLKKVGKTTRPFRCDLNQIPYDYTVKVKVAQFSSTLCDPIVYTVHGIILEWVAFPSSRDFSTQGSNPGFPHCRRILYQWSHKGSPRILEWVSYPFSSGSSWPRN